MSTPEGRVKAMVKREMSRFTHLYKFMPVQNGMGAPGLDFFYSIAGRFVAIETKVPGKKLTERQKQTAREVCASGGLVLAVRDKEDMDNGIEHICRRRPDANGYCDGYIMDRLDPPSEWDPPVGDYVAVFKD